MYHIYIDIWGFWSIKWDASPSWGAQNQPWEIVAYESYDGISQP